MSSSFASIICLFTHHMCTSVIHSTGEGDSLELKGSKELVSVMELPSYSLVHSLNRKNIRDSYCNISLAATNRFDFLDIRLRMSLISTRILI